jgi:protein phosphatase
MSNKIINIDCKDNYKIVAISDIHGHFDHFKKLIDKLSLKSSDYLIIIGDFINRGPNSYETYSFIKNLSTRPNTIILKGNHESFIYNSLKDKKRADVFLEHFKAPHYKTIIDDFVQLSNFDFQNCTSGIAFQKNIFDHHFETLEFINSLPVMVNFDEFIFVHGGYDPAFKLPEDEGRFLKYDNYNKVSGINDKMVVVGHWPASNLRHTILTNLPLFNTQKNIITIDGGLGVKTSGELNAFIIEKKNGQIHYDCLQQNDFELKTINRGHKFKKEKTIIVNYPNFEVEVIEKGDRISLCKHKKTNQYLSVFNSLLENNGRETSLKTIYVNKFFNLNPGEVVEVCKTYDDCVLIKHDNEFGWILKEQL